MSNKRKFCFLIALSIVLFCQCGNGQRVSFQTRPSEFQVDDESNPYQPFTSEYSKSFGNLVKNERPSELSNTGLSFPTNNAENGFQRDYDFGSSGRDEKNRREWNHEDSAHNQRGNGHNWSRNEEKSQGFSSFSTQQSKKNSGAGDNSKWNNAFQNTESGNQMNSNPFLDSGSNHKKNIGFNKDLGWNTDIKNEDSENREYQVAAGKRIPGDNLHTNPNNWISGFNSDKKLGVSQTGMNSRKPGDPKHFSNQFNPFQANHIKPGGSNTGTNQWNTAPKPGKINKKPSQGNGNDKTSAQKPSISSSNSKPGTEGEQIDWTNLERENKKSTLVVDLSQLWYPTNRRNSNQDTMKSKKRNVSTEHQNNCYCVEYEECNPDRRVDVSHVFGSDNSRLRSMLVDCAKENKVCCFTTTRVISKKSYEIQGTNLRPTCGKRISKNTPNDETEEGLANYGDFPWILRLISLEEGESEKTLCSASLIHSSIALATASCALLLTGDNIRARAGEWNAGTGHERNKIQEVKIRKIYLHPNFDFVSYTNDFALILLDEAFDYNLGTNSVCLPSPNDAWDSSRCVVSGWFKENVQGIDKPLLSKTHLTNVVRGKCPNTSEYAISDAGMEDTSYICAHARGGDLCIADAGALMCPLYNSDMLVLVGFLSRSGTCNKFYGTGTFIDLMESVDWITHMEGIYLYFRNKQLQQ